MGIERSDLQRARVNEIHGFCGLISNTDEFPGNTLGVPHIHSAALLGLIKSMDNYSTAMSCRLGNALQVHALHICTSQIVRKNENKTPTACGDRKGIQTLRRAWKAKDYT